MHAPPSHVNVSVLVVVFDASTIPGALDGGVKRGMGGRRMVEDADDTTMVIRGLNMAFVPTMLGWVLP